VASNTPYISPFPFSADLYDRFDFEFINLLGKINAGDFQDKIESLESRGFRRNPEDIPYHGLLNIISTQKNHPLFVADSFHGSGSEQKGALLYDGRCLPVDSPGSTALEMGRSLYRRGDSLLVDGVIGRWGTGTANRGQLQHSSEHMVLDLGKTPGRILRHIVEIGMLTGDRQDVPSGMGMLLSEMLSTKPGPRELIAVHETLGGMVAKGVISESTGIHWVQRGGGSNSSKALSVAAEPTVPVKASRVEKMSGGALARLRKAIELSGRVAVVGTTGLTKDGGKPIAGAFLHDGIPYVMQAMNTGATVTVMPNEHVARAGRSRRDY